MFELDTHPSSVPSCLNDGTRQWQTAIEYRQAGLAISPAGFTSATNVLLTQPNLNSSHLFRADILYDSAKQLKTPVEHEKDRGFTTVSQNCDEDASERPPATFAGFTHTRTVVRRLVPRNSQLDKPMTQSCHMYEAGASRHLVAYLPHVGSVEGIPWYHPPVKALAYLYEVSPVDQQGLLDAALSVHILPFEAISAANSTAIRLHRTLLSLLNTLSRLAISMSKSPADTTANIAIAPKDNIIPQHIVQNTYARLKRTYSVDLIRRWVEKTEPSKHIFEDLSIAAFLIELWRQMYGVVPECERSGSASSYIFPGFVDIACGNGVLVYVLRTEGYKGWGLDARRRRTWNIFPGNIQEHLHEQVLVPEPYLRTDIQASMPGDHPPKYLDKGRDSLAGIEYHNGIFEAGTFIISNHADELTPWTPILAALSNPVNPLPWLAIPCCSHALSGVKHRYPIPKPISQPGNDASTRCSIELDSRTFELLKVGEHGSSITTPMGVDESPETIDISNQPAGDEEQPANGDLKTLRAAKAKVASGADQSSMYACLTAKVIALAEELGIETERTLMRIPSTRNIGIVGARRRVIDRVRLQTEMQTNDNDGGQTVKLRAGLEAVDIAGYASSSTREDPPIFDDLLDRDGRGGPSEQKMLTEFQELLERECRSSGGVQVAAQVWIERAKSLQRGRGRGKLNAGKAHA